MKKVITRSIFFALFIIFSNSIYSQTANVTTADDIICPGEDIDLIVAFTGTANFDFSYTYNGVTTPVSTSDNPVVISITATVAGNVVISLFSDNTGPGVILDNQFVIALHPAISLSIPEDDPSYVEMGEDLVITTNLAGGGGGESYVWTGHASVAASIVSSATFNSGAATGSSLIDVTVTDVNSCEASDNITVNAVNLVVSTSSTPGSAQICEGSTITMDGIPASGSGSYSHAWTWASTGETGSFDFPANEDPIFTPDGPDVFTLTYTVTDDKTGQVESDDIVVTVNALPVVKNEVVTDYCANDAGLGTVVVQNIEGATDYKLINDGTTIQEGATLNGPATPGL